MTARRPTPGRKAGRADPLDTRSGASSGVRELGDGSGPGGGSCPRLVHAWPGELMEGRLVRRYERFVAEVRLGRKVVRAHCVNSGRMEGMIIPGAKVWLSRAPHQRALEFTWELMELDGVMVGANTALPNRLVKISLERGLLGGLTGTSVVAEQPMGRNHRVDLVLEGPAGREFIEVKNCHLVYPDFRGYFPDSHSERAVRHVNALARLAARNVRAHVVFTLQRLDALALRPSDLHAPDFAQAVRRAARAGVRFRALRFRPGLDGVWLDAEVPVELERYDLDDVARWSAALDDASGWLRKDGRMAGRSVTRGASSQAKERRARNSLS
jgi:sugar fermentation stimulation protein A